MTQAEPLKILLVDDHLVVRAGLRQLLESIPGVHVSAEAQSGEEALYLVSLGAPDIVIMDLKMDGMGGAEAIRILRDTAPQTRIVALSSDVDRALLDKVWALGTHGFLLKTCTAEELESTIFSVMQGQRVLDQGLESLQAQPHVPVLSAELSQQQRRVLALLTKGLTNPEIAAHLGISVPTARFHVSAILLKLGVSNRVEAVALATEHALVRPEDFGDAG